MARKRLVVLAVVLAVAGSAAALAAGDESGDSGAPERATGTARLERRDLVLTDSFDGTLGYGEARPLVSERAGVVTTVTNAKTTVTAGGELFRVDFEPTVLLTGDVPAYRELDTSSTNGADIRQLEQGLVDAGHGAGVNVDEDFTSGTAAAVARWEKALGRADPDGTVELGDVIFLPHAVRIASVEADKGTRVTAGATVVTATSTQRVVEVDLEAARADELEPGTKVQLTMPDDTETTGTVASVGAESDSSDDTPAGPGGEEPTLPVIISLDDPAAAGEFESGSVDVDIERSREEGAVVAPVTALVALAEGGYAVQLADGSAPNGYRLVGVEVGANTNQLVSISGDGIEPGAEVVVPR